MLKEVLKTRGLSDPKRAQDSFWEGPDPSKEVPGGSGLSEGCQLLRGSPQTFLVSPTVDAGPKVARPRKQNNKYHACIYTHTYCFSILCIYTYRIM